MTYAMKSMAPARGSHRNTAQASAPVSQDLVWLGVFATTAETLTPSALQVTSPDVLAHLRTLPSRVGRWGGTNLTAGIDAALRFLAAVPRPLGRKLTIIGDGEANIGAHELPARGQLLRQHWVAVRCIDVGNGAGRATLSGVAAATVGGRYDVASEYGQLAAFVGARGRSHQSRTFATALLVDVSPSMSAPFAVGMTRIEAAQRAAAEWVSTQAKLYGGRQ